MLKEITTEFITELREKVLSGEIKHLEIKKDDTLGGYVAEYHMQEPTELEDKSKVFVMLAEMDKFKTAMQIDAVINFELTYIPEKEIVIVNRSYSQNLNGDEINKRALVNDYLDKVKSLLKDLNLDTTKVPLFEKNNLGNKKVKYSIVRAEEAVNKIISAIE